MKLENDTKTMKIIENNDYFYTSFSYFYEYEILMYFLKKIDESRCIKT